MYGPVLITNGPERYLYGNGSTKLSNGDIIDRSQLVLLKCTIDSFISNGNNAGVYLTFTNEIYDLDPSNPDYNDYPDSVRLAE